ncbi:polysaccharide deacetylase family protein [Nocardioides sp. S-58]|uniref:Polysaccharide deacetylase family protein n=1 Tax=Nocardioides renjunii TaxID=3095075 RepID=A0ABU5K6P3_9ACTN|nr:polysaccharide deacetylase family protein [Nocardioides sp. S-58]MDZ5660547.1 polysaccharide deacetylase family protein [Nocardioides sp. S-58]
MRVVNVCFHGIGSPGRVLEPGEETYWTGRDTFLGILDRVAGRDDVRLSFDDGNASDASIALPALQERGLTATFFVVAGRLDQPGSLSREDVRRLHGAGMTIGNHGMTHRPWRGLDPGRQQEELVAARQALAEVTGHAVRDAACPLGRYDRHVLGALRRLGYRSAHTSDRRWARTDSWIQPRYSIHAGDTPESVEREVLRRPAAPVRAKGAAVGAVKRLR